MNTPSQSGSTSGGQPPWEPPSPEELGESLPAYEVTEILGRGGMGAVYKARQKSLKRWVAIKVLPLVAADDELKFAERFRNEAETMARMSHPAIVNVHDFGETSDGLLYIVMEFIDGTDVQKMIHGSGALSGDYALAITAHVCDALTYAHGRGVIHRDIKPANILIDQEGNVKVADFGLAKMSHPDLDYGLTRSNVAMGTPDYVAPEVLSYGLVADHRADLYAIGVMLYQMLTGEVPRGLFKLPSQKGIDADPRFDDIICKAMEPDRDERYQSAMDVRAALDVILTTALPIAGEGAGVAPIKKAAKKTSAPWFVIAGIVAALAVGGIVMVAMNGKSPNAATTGSPVSAPVDDAFLREVAAAPAARQVELVREKIEAISGAKVTLTPEISSSGKVTQLTVEQIPDVLLADLSPLGALSDLVILTIEAPGAQDISWMRGMKIGTLYILGGRFTDISALKDLPLIHLSLLNCIVTDFSDLAGKPLQSFSIIGKNPIQDLSFIRGMPLNTLRVEKVGVTDWSPLRGLPLRDLTADLDPLREAEILRSFSSLQKFNTKPAEELWALIGNPATQSSPTSTAGKTIDLLPLVDVKRDTVAGEWSRDGGDLLVEATKSDANGTPRLQLPYQPPEEYDFEIEFTPESGDNKVVQILSAYQRPFTWQVGVKLNAGIKAGFTQIGGKSLFDTTEGTAMRPSFLTTGRRHRSTVEVRRTGLRGLLDSQQVVAWGAKPESYQSLDIHPNDALRDTLHLGLGGFERAVRFHKITVREITGTGKVDAGTSNDASPVITNWQDVTGSVREMAHGTSGLSVENDGTIRHTPEGRFPKLTLTKPDQRNNAVRVRYTGEVQIGLRSNTTNTDYLFVLCEANQTIFAKFHGDEAKKSEKIGLTKTHPPGFEPDREHELLVTLQGTRFRAWMDGVFWGEGNDDTLTEGTTVLVFTPKMVVKKVEIAELAPSPSDAAPLSQTVQGHRYQFVAGEYTWTEAKTEAEKLGGHLAVITSAEVNDWAWKTFSTQLPPQPKEDRWKRGWWLGASQTVQEKPWSWLTDEPLSYECWGIKEPSASISPPRYLWMADANKKEGSSNWSAQNGWIRGGFLLEWDTLVAAPAVAAPWTDRLGTMKWETPWSMKDGALSTSAPTTMQELGQVGDGALRIRARVAAGTDKGQFRGPTLQPALRIGPVKGATNRQGSYQFQAYLPGGACSLVYLERDLKTGTDLPPEYLWKDSALPPDLRGKEEIEWEFRAVGDDLSAWADGQFVASARDARVPSGRSKLTAFPGIEITSVETSGITPKRPTAANQNDLPNIMNWQDVTESVREKAQSNPQLVVESDQIRHVGQGASPRIQLSPDGLRDYAVRLHFTGESQVNLRRDDYGFIYVLCQRSQTIFQRYDKAEPDPIVLIPTLLHPPGYDSTQPHELLVTMEGSTIRTWLDGRFLGEAHDDTLANGCADVAFTKYCTVRKVEFAELEPSPSVTSANWQPLFTKPEDFGTNAAKVEFRDGWLFVNTAKTHYAPTDTIDGAIRATLRFHPKNTANLTARANDGAPWGKEAYACSVFITPDGKTATIMATMEKIDGEKPWKRHDFPLPAALREGEEFALELRVEGDQIGVLFNRKELGSVTHPFPETKRRFGIMPSTTGISEFRDVAWQKLE